MFSLIFISEGESPPAGSYKYTFINALKRPFFLSFSKYKIGKVVMCDVITPHSNA